jgi:hypothetical protein
MSAPKRARDARDDESGGAAAEGAGGAPPPPPLPPPPARRRPATRSIVAAAVAVEARDYERRLKLTDVIGFVAQNGYAREANACAGLNRETWRCIPAGLSAADADRVRRDHPLWQAIIDLKHGRFEETRLCRAARKGQFLVVRGLCDWRADIEARDYRSSTPLMLAYMFNHVAVMHELLACGANTEAARDAPLYGRTKTLLSYASEGGRRLVVRELLVFGANIEAADGDGLTSLHVASENGHLTVVRELLSHGANIEAATDNRDTSLYIASFNGHLDVVRELLARGANIEATTNQGLTPLIIASSCGFVDVVRALLVAGANKHHIDKGGWTATSCAAAAAAAADAAAAGDWHGVEPAAIAAILALLAAAP